MNTQRLQELLVGFILAVISLSADAVPTLQVFPYAPQQVGTTSSMRLGLTVQANTVWHVLTVGGGYTTNCDGSTLSVTAERSASASDILGNVSLTVTVPVTTPASYPILGWSSITQGQCKQCSFQYTGRAIDASASISTGTFGATFQFNAGTPESIGDTRIFDVCRPNPPPPGGGGGPTGCIP